MDFKRDEAIRRDSMNQAKMDVDREKLQAQRDIAATNLEIARENKNKYDVQKSPKTKNTDTSMFMVMSVQDMNSSICMQLASTWLEFIAWTDMTMNHDHDCNLPLKLQHDQEP